MVKIENLNLEIYGIIYLIRNKVNRKYYVGQTQREKGFDYRYYYSGEGIERVYNYHKSLREHNRSYNEHLLRSIEKYGFEAFEVIKCLDYAFSLEELNIKEKVYVQLYNSLKNGYNETLGGDGTEGRSHSEETKQKISEAKKGKHPSEETKQKISEANSGEKHHMYGKHHTEEVKQKMSEAKKGENNPMYGKYHTEEVKQKISEGNKGKCLSNEAKQKISEANSGEKNPFYGKHHTEEVKQKISEARKSKYVGEDHPRAKAVYCYERNEIKLTAKEWSEELCLYGTSITQCCKGKYKSTGGYHFRYATEEEIEEYKNKNKKTIDK